MSVETKTPEIEYLVGRDVVYETVFRPQVPASETQTSPQNDWMRTQKQLFEGGPVETVIRNNKNTQINFTEIPLKEDPPRIDSSIRLTLGDETYTFRYDRETDGFERWEIIETIRPENAKEEQVKFKDTQTVPNFIINNEQAPIWREFVGDVNRCISTLPPEYPEKKVLEKVWKHVIITDQKTFDAERQLQKDIEIEKRASELKKETEMFLKISKSPEPSLLQKAKNKIKLALGIESKHPYRSNIRTEPYKPNPYH